MPFGVVEEIEFVFPIVGFLVQQILGIINFKLKLRDFFPSLVYSPIWGNVLYNRIILICYFFEYKVAKWCQGWLQGPFTLVEWIDFEIDMERKLDEFEDSFEWDELKED